MQYRDVNEDGLALIYIDRYVGHFPSGDVLLYAAIIDI